MLGAADGLDLIIAESICKASILSRLPILATNPNDQSAYNLLISKGSVLLARGLRRLEAGRAAEKIRPQRAFSAGVWRLEGGREVRKSR